jgi:hypothetical protein
LLSGGAKYGEIRARGGSIDDARKGSLLSAGAATATQILPMGFLVKNFGKTEASELVSGFLARDLPSEVVSTVVQKAIDTSIANPDATFEESLTELPGEIRDNVAEAFLQAGLFGMAKTAASGNMKPELGRLKAKATINAVGNLMQAAQGSKLLKRDPESFQAASRE